MKYTEYSKNLATIQDHYEDAKKRGVVLVVKGNSNKKGLLTQHPSCTDRVILVGKDGSLVCDSWGAMSDEPFMRWKLVGEIDFSTELD